MYSYKMPVSLALLAMLVVVAHSSSSSGGEESFSYDISDKSELRKLYNSNVFEAERMRRRMKNIPLLYHSGVRVTLADGSRWLIHKGNKYGISSQTVVVDADHMSSKWEVMSATDFRGTKTVADFVTVGGSEYHLLNDNCNQASARMMGQSDCPLNVRLGWE